MKRVWRSRRAGVGVRGCVEGRGRRRGGRTVGRVRRCWATCCKAEGWHWPRRRGGMPGAGVVSKQVEAGGCVWRLAHGGGLMAEAAAGGVAGRGGEAEDGGQAGNRWRGVRGGGGKRRWGCAGRGGKCEGGGGLGEAGNGAASWVAEGGGGLARLTRWPNGHRILWRFWSTTDTKRATLQILYNVARCFVDVLQGRVRGHGFPEMIV